MITKQMLVAIDELLNDKNGIDITGLVNDLVINEEERVETSIMVKLLIANKLKFDTNARYSYTYGGAFIKYEYIAHSYIKDVVKVKETLHEYNEEAETYVTKNTYESSMSIESWEHNNTNLDETLAKVKEIYDRKHSKK
jgi:hypothetical protein